MLIHHNVHHHAAHFKFVSIHFDKEEQLLLQEESSVANNNNENVINNEINTNANAATVTTTTGGHQIKVTRVNSAPISPSPVGVHKPSAGDQQQLDNNDGTSSSLTTRSIGHYYYRNTSADTTTNKAPATQHHIHGHGQYCHHGLRVSFMPGEMVRGRVEIDVTHNQQPSTATTVAGITGGPGGPTTTTADGSNNSNNSGSSSMTGGGGGGHHYHLPHITLPRIINNLPHLLGGSHSHSSHSSQGQRSHRKGRSVSESAATDAKTADEAHAHHHHHDQHQHQHHQHHHVVATKKIDEREEEQDQHHHEHQEEENMMIIKVSNKEDKDKDGAGSLTSSSSSASSASSSESSNYAQQNSLTITSIQSNTSASAAPPGSREILLRLEGYGKTQWRVAGENGGRAHMREPLVNMQLPIRIPPDLPPGRHSFPFEFELPDDLPPSFDGKHGFIRYRLRVKHGHHHGFNLKLPFNVVYAERVDDDALLKPVEDNRQRNIHFWCVSRGSRSVHAKVDRTVYHYQGDVVYINARFSNECRQPARPTVKLIQQQTFYGRGLISKTFKKSVQAWLLTPSADLSPLQPDEDRIWVNVECTLPVVTPSFHSAIIDVDYYLEIELADSTLSLPSKAAAKMLMSHSATHNAVASIWILIADGAFQKKPSASASNNTATGADRAAVPASTAALLLTSNNSKGSLISDTSSDFSTAAGLTSASPMTPLTITTMTSAPPAPSTTATTTVINNNNKDSSGGGSPLAMKKMPYIREDSKEG